MAACMSVHHAQHCLHSANASSHVNVCCKARKGCNTLSVIPMFVLIPESAFSITLPVAIGALGMRRHCMISLAHGSVRRRLSLRVARLSAAVHAVCLWQCMRAAAGLLVMTSMGLLLMACMGLCTLLRRLNGMQRFPCLSCVVLQILQAGFLTLLQQKLFKFWS